MHRSTTRRQFLHTVAAGSAMLGVVPGLPALPGVSAAEAQLDPNVVRLDPSIEPLVRLIETTPRDRLIEEIGSRIRHDGLSYRELLAALLLAGVRNVEPRPSVGFKFHSVLVVNSAHLASLASPDEDRWLPIFWALDYFKSAQAQDDRERGWTMKPVSESALPPPHRARAAFIEAMENWDEEAADAAVASLARSAGASDIFELFFHYGGRDFRSIGHKAIYVANSYRTLACIGWHHAEPVLRSLAYALLMHEGDNPAKRDDEADRPWRRNQQLAAEFDQGWRGGRIDADATSDMLATLRGGSADDACTIAVEHINAGVSPQSIWDAMFDGAGELLLRQPGIVALHAVTTTNALHYAYRTAADDMNRRLVLLQNAAFLPMFREAMGGRGRVAERSIDELKPMDAPGSEPGDPSAVFAGLGRDTDERLTAAGKALGYLQRGGHPGKLIDTARRLVFMKGNDAHDYKFSSAVLEDYHHVSPKWRDAFLASSVMQLCGGGEPDNQLVERTRAALG